MSGDSPVVARARAGLSSAPNPHGGAAGADIRPVDGKPATHDPERRFLAIGAEHGAPDLTLIVGPSLPELTRKLQRLVGVTPLPPAWALG